MSRLAKAVLAGAGVAALFVLAPTGTAAADEGDGTLSCVRGEICFAQHSPNENLGGLKHFWWGAQHTGISFHNGFGFYDAASSIWNRDTECQVRIHDDGDSPWEGAENLYIAPRQSGGYGYIGDDFNDENASHHRERCV